MKKRMLTKNTLGVDTVFTEHVLVDVHLEKKVNVIVEIKNEGDKAIVRITRNGYRVSEQYIRQGA